MLQPISSAISTGSRSMSQVVSWAAAVVGQAVGLDLRGGEVAGHVHRDCFRPRRWAATGACGRR